MSQNINFISKNYYSFVPSLTGKLFDKRKGGCDLSEEQISQEGGLDISKTEIKIKVYEDRVAGWFLDFAKKLSDNEGDAGFIVLSIAVSYIEGNQQFREGKLSKNNSCNFFVRGMKRIFDKEEIPEEIIKKYYNQVRCGLFHDGITKKNVSISGGYNNPISYSAGKIFINPHKFLDKIILDFKLYISQLSENLNLRDNFERRWNLENDETNTNPQN